MRSLPFRRRRNGSRKARCYYHHFPKLLPPWPIDGRLQVAHVSPMAAKVRKSWGFGDNLRALRDPTPRFPDSVAHSQNGRFESYVNLRPGRDPMPQILDSVGNPKIWCSRSYVNLQGSCHPTPHFLGSVGSSENRPSLSPGNGATFALKVPCFAVSFFAGWRISRAAAPDLGESSIGVVGFGLPGGGAQSAR